MANSLGGLRKGSGRGKKGWYRGYWCDSTWELAWMIWALDKGIQFSRNLQAFSYTYKDRVRKFYPDFILQDGTFLEIKGWFDAQTHAKLTSVQGMTVLGKWEMQPILAYAKAQFGVDFYETLYQLPPRYKCGDCKARVTKYATRCHSCASSLVGRTLEKISWPSNTELLAMVRGSNWEAVARQLGVSSTAVRKRLRRVQKFGHVAPMVERCVEAAGR